MGEAALSLDYADYAQIHPGRWTYQDYLDLPEDGYLYEIIEGMLYMASAPDITHQFIVVKLIAHLEYFVSLNHLGYVLTAPFEVHLSETSRPVQPDVLFIRKENWPGAGKKYFEGAPDLVIEVMSPSSFRNDQFVKFNAYEKAGVPEYWIINSKLRCVQTFFLENRKYSLKEQFSGDELIESRILEGLHLKTSSLFAIGE